MCISFVNFLIKSKNKKIKNTHQIANVFLWKFRLKHNAYATARHMRSFNDLSAVISIWGMLKRLELREMLDEDDPRT